MLNQEDLRKHLKKVKEIKNKHLLVIGTKNSYVTQETIFYMPLFINLYCKITFSSNCSCTDIFMKREKRFTWKRIIER